MALHSNSRQQIRHYTSRILNDIDLGVVATPGSGTFVCTAWEHPDDHFNKWREVFCYSGTGIGTTGNPTDWVNSTHTLTFLPAATLTTADLVELHRTWAAVEYNDAINLAIEEVMDDALTMENDTTLKFDDLLTNSSFDSGHATGWSEGGTGTFSDEATLKRRGTYSGKVLNTAANAAWLYQSISNYSLYVAKSITTHYWCYATTANRVRMALTDGVTTWYSDYHDGTGWEELSIDGKEVASTATALTVQLRTETGGAITVYWDEGWLAADHVYQYTIPSGFVYIHKAEMESSVFDLFNEQDAIDNKYWRILPGSASKIEFIYDLFSPVAGRVLRISGLQKPSILSADTTTTGISPNYLAYQAAAYLHASRIRGSQSDAEDHAKQFAFWQSKADQQKAKMRTSLSPGSRKVYV